MGEARELSIIVGPEGGFTAEEAERAVSVALRDLYA